MTARTYSSMTEFNKITHAACLSTKEGTLWHTIPRPPQQKQEQHKHSMTWGASQPLLPQLRLNTSPIAQTDYERNHKQLCLTSVSLGSEIGILVNPFMRVTN